MKKTVVRMRLVDGVALRYSRVFDVSSWMIAMAVFCHPSAGSDSWTADSRSRARRIGSFCCTMMVVPSWRTLNCDPTGCPHSDCSRNLASSSSPVEAADCCLDYISDSSTYFGLGSRSIY